MTKRKVKQRWWAIQLESGLLEINPIRRDENYAKADLAWCRRFLDPSKYKKAKVIEVTVTPTRKKK